MVRFILLFLCAGALQAADIVGVPVPLTNADFRQGLAGWTAYGEVQPRDAQGALRLSVRSSVQRRITVSRGTTNGASRRYLVQVRARNVDHSTLRMTVRCHRQFVDLHLRDKADWTVLEAVVDTPPFLPGAGDTPMEIALSSSDTGTTEIDWVKVAAVPDYRVHLRFRTNSKVPVDGAFRFLRHHRDTGHEDGVRHRYFSALPYGTKIKPGEFSPWFDLQRHLFGRGIATLTLQLNQDGSTDPLDVEIELATVLALPKETAAADDFPEDDPLGDLALDEPTEPKPLLTTFYTTRVTTANPFVSLLVPENHMPPKRFIHAPRTIAEDVERRLKLFATGDLPPMPKEIRVGLNLSNMTACGDAAMIAKELTILRHLGVNATPRSGDRITQDAFDKMRLDAGFKPPFGDRFYGRISADDYCSPYDGDRWNKIVDAHYTRLAKTLNERGDVQHIKVIELLDEPPDIAPTAVDNPAFRAFLKRHKITPAELGFASWDQVALPLAVQETIALPNPEDGPDLTMTDAVDAELEEQEAPPQETEADATMTLEQRRLHYYMRVFIAERTADTFAAATAAVERHLPGILTSVNFRAGLRRVLTSETADWFTFGRRKSVTMMWNEDWLNSYGWRNNGIQLVSYYTELMRTAARKHQLPQGCFVICMGHELQKAYSALAHGSRHISFWRYGPDYANYLPYSWSNSPTTMNHVATFSHDVAAIEALLKDARRAPAKVALLYAKADPVWGRSQAENRLVYMALLHDQVAVDIITEADIEEDGILPQYEMVYVTDQSIRTQTQQHLAIWVQAGGHLWLSGGAATRDEFDTPSTIIDTALGITRKPAGTRPVKIPGHTPLAAPVELRHWDLPGDQIQVTGTAGGGTFTATSFPVGTYYEAPVRARFNRQHGKGRIQGGWSAETRHLITRAAKEHPGTRPVPTTLPGIETMLYQHPESSVIMLINYSGEPSCQVTVTLPTAQPTASVRSLRQGPLTIKDGTVTLLLGDADSLIVTHD